MLSANVLPDAGVAAHARRSGRESWEQCSLCSDGARHTDMSGVHERARAAKGGKQCGKFGKRVHFLGCGDNAAGRLGEMRLEVSISSHVASPYAGDRFVCSQQSVSLLCALRSSHTRETTENDDYVPWRKKFGEWEPGKTFLNSFLAEEIGIQSTSKQMKKRVRANLARPDRIPAVLVDRKQPIF
eukprot:583454-Pleurochrysis_carterae.AAC.2